MLNAYPLTAIVLTLALLVYLWVTMRASAARAKHGVKAPSTEGPPEYQRIFRVQMNTLEQLVVFVPALVIFASGWGDGIAALIGIIWPIGRVDYALGYYEGAEKRSRGFGIALVSTVVLLVGGFAAALVALF